MTDHETAFTDDVVDELPERVHRQRVLLGLIISMLLGIGALSAPVLYFVDGTLHSIPLRCGVEGVPSCEAGTVIRAVALLAAATIVAFATRQPHRPDAAITRNLVVAIAVVGVVVGLTELVDALSLRSQLGDGGTYQGLRGVTAQPGPAAIAVPLAGAIAAYTGLRRGLWPESRSAQELRAAQARRAQDPRRSRRKR